MFDKQSAKLVVDIQIDLLYDDFNGEQNMNEKEIEMKGDEQRRNELMGMEKEKLVDMLLVYIHDDEKRKQKVREMGKKWRDKRKDEIEELRKFKELHDVK